jgi:hypothetical protein
VLLRVSTETKEKNGSDVNRKNAPMCGKTKTTGDEHTHVCTENENHPGKHSCGAGTDNGICGYTW